MLDTDSWVAGRTSSKKPNDAVTGLLLFYSLIEYNLWYPSPLGHDINTLLLVVVNVSMQSDWRFCSYVSIIIYYVNVVLVCVNGNSGGCKTVEETKHKSF